MIEISFFDFFSVNKIRGKDKKVSDSLVLNQLSKVDKFSLMEFTSIFSQLISILDIFYNTL
jgi:hypothetical protein